MTKRYSPSTGGFYETELHGASIPADAVYVAPARHAELLAAQAQGATIQASSATGNPVIAAAPSPDHAALVAAAQMAAHCEADKRIHAVMPLTRQVAILRQQAVSGMPFDEATRAAFAAIAAIEAAAQTIVDEIEHRSIDELRTWAARENPLWPETL
ncbi:putative tail fiber assembly protein [Qipengyuania citrea LAMA 915]|uniref:Putative tail fiber assembly protein n=1 Tax=Qipengyuania citrea LAMA 915 TaxID=1306953 RepID=A0A0L1KFJ7_9SPHN|nr:hypothetical protein [Qipengyuania citrea]KNH02617.1 putative tail fiber assembly protein [Qipengyuania citrea LAMA 915]